jgi:uncharacterized protein YqeY
MALLQKIEASINEAVKHRDVLNQMKVASLRIAKDNIQKKAKALKRDLLESEEIAELESLVKKHKESIEAFAKGRRDDLVNTEIAQKGFIEEFLPKEIDVESIKNLVCEHVTMWAKDNGVPTKKHMGLLIKSFKDKLTELKVRAEGSAISEAVKSHLD